MTGDGSRSARRRRLPVYPWLLAGIARLALRSLARVEVTGLEEVPVEGPLIVAVNHMSNADPPLVAGWLAPALGRRPTFLAKASLFTGPVGAFMRSNGVIPVKAGGSDVDAYRAARSLLEDGGVVVIFPEGTRSRDGVLADFRPGVALLALRTGVPVLPVGISGTDRFLGRGAGRPRIGTRIRVRVGRPFVMRPDPDVSRREALARGDAAIRAAIAGLLDARHRPPDARREGIETAREDP
jgi:1-acyl-sn-glycerol-3-phosphate acyltransferase